MTAPGDLNLETHGAALFSGVLSTTSLERLRHEAVGAGRIRTGKRIFEADEGFIRLLGPDGEVGKIASLLLSPSARPVRVLKFDKTPASNWSVAWHQDRAIAVAERREAIGFGPWSVKDGVAHVAPPIEVLSRMITLRAHLDDCGPDNAPLIVALGSQKFGKVAARQAAEIADRFELAICQAKAGDIWAYSTPILHASEPTRSPSHRRVLQVDYADFDLPARLGWHGLRPKPI